MHEPKWDSMNEKDFDAMLSGSIPELPPQEAVQGVTPWKRGMSLVLAGMAMTTVTLHFWCLQYLLPVIGLVLCLLGFRTLRRENGWFEACFLLAALRCVTIFPTLILNATIFQSSVLTQSVSLVLTVVDLLLRFAGFFCLWRGLLAVQRKAGLPPKAGAAFALLVWFALLCALGVIRYSGWIVLSAMVAGYVLILCSLYKISKSLAEAGYAIRPAAVRVSDWGVALTLIGVLVMGCAAGYLFGSSYPMDWQAAEPVEQTETMEIKKHLLELGFPEDVLRDLAAEELAACKDALRIVVETNYHDPEDTSGTEVSERSEMKKLRMTSIAVEVPDDEERWIVIHHFLWLKSPNFFGTEVLQILPPYEYISEGWRSDGQAAGRVLYDKAGTTYTAPYYFLGEKTFTTVSFWGDAATRTDLFAAFSMPRQGEAHRGYVAYPVAEVTDGCALLGYAFYTHQSKWSQYPVSTAMDTRVAGAFGGADETFVTMMHVLDLDPANMHLLN